MLPPPPPLINLSKWSIDFVYLVSRRAKDFLIAVSGISTEDDYKSYKKTRLILVLRAQFRGRFFTFSLDPLPIDNSQIVAYANVMPHYYRFRLLTVVVSDSFILLTTHRIMYFKHKLVII